MYIHVPVGTHTYVYMRIYTVHVPVYTCTYMYNVCICTMYILHALMHTHVQSEAANPIGSFLEYFTLPNDESTPLDPKLVATVSLSHLDRLATPYYSMETVCIYMYIVRLLCMF